MVDLSILATPSPYHILTFGTLLGSQFYQSFVAGVVAYKALERPSFSKLQQKIFPVYFSLQTALPVVLALTYPGSPLGPSSGLVGIFAEANRWTVLAPILTVFVSSLSNLVLIGPATTKVLLDRQQREKKDGKRCIDPPPHSAEMQQLNKAFGRMHGISSLLNIVGWWATVYYGISIAKRIQ